MAISYMDAVSQGYPTVQAHCDGNPFVYDNLEWSGGDALPSQDDLDLWIIEESDKLSHSVTKYQFRQLFTVNERVGIDNVQTNPNVPANYKALLVTVMKDLELSAIVQLNNPNVIKGVMMLEQLGLIAVGRGATILSNTLPDGTHAEYMTGSSV